MIAKTSCFCFSRWGGGVPLSFLSVHHPPGLHGGLHPGRVPHPPCHAAQLPLPPPAGHQPDWTRSATTPLSYTRHTSLSELVLQDCWSLKFLILQQLLLAINFVNLWKLQKWFPFFFVCMTRHMPSISHHKHIQLEILNKARTLNILADTVCHANRNSQVRHVFVILTMLA